MPLKQLKAQFKNLNKTQQRFVKYVIVIKISVLIIAIAVLILAWKYFMQ